MTANFNDFAFALGESFWPGYWAQIAAGVAQARAGETEPLASSYPTLTTGSTDV